MSAQTSAVSASNSFRHASTEPRIALINLMDNAAGTERHFLKTLEKASPKAHVTLCRMDCAKNGSDYFREYEHLLSDRYVSWQDVIGKTYFDLVIVTGIDRGKQSYEELDEKFPDFWQESQDLIHTLDQSTKTGTVGHTALICWAAFAAPKILYDIDKSIRSKKLYGLFEHNNETPDHPLLQGIEQKNLIIPHSRFSTMNERDIRRAIDQSNGSVILNGPDGPALWTLDDERITCIINHPEYSLDTLKREYDRDSSKNKAFPKPENYNPENIDTPENRQIFSDLGELCSTFYKNLIHHAVAARTHKPVLHQKETAEQTFGIRRYG